MTELRLKIMTGHISKLLEQDFGSICPVCISNLLKMDEIVSNFEKYYPFNLGMLEQGYTSSCADTGCPDPHAMCEEYKNLILIPAYKKLIDPVRKEKSVEEAINIYENRNKK